MNAKEKIAYFIIILGIILMIFSAAKMSAAFRNHKKTTIISPNKCTCQNDLRYRQYKEPPVVTYKDYHKFKIDNLHNFKK